MKPVHTYGGYQTFDLTEGKVHRLAQPDGSAKIVALFPKVWTEGPRQTMPLLNGQVVEWKPYWVTEWDEVVLATVPAPTG